MSSIPPELIGLIVSEIDDFPTLKSCSLAGSIFRHPSQRILLNSVRLRSARWISKFSTFLEDSPHVARYITQVSLRFLFNAPDTVLDHLQRIFNRLTNVRRCRIIGQLTFLLSLNFLRHQPLRELHLKYLNVSPVVLVHMLSTAPPLYTLSGSHVFLTQRADDLAVGASQNAPKIENLELSSHTICLYELLLHPQLKPYTRALRSLSMHAFDDRNSRLVFQTADTLEHITLNFGGIETPETLLVPFSLPRLRSVKLSLPFRTHRWIQLVIRFLDASPLLADIQIFFDNISSNSPDPGKQLMYALDAAGAGHSAGPQIWWQFAGSSDESARQHVDAAAVALSSGMPQMCAKGRLRFSKS